MGSFFEARRKQREAVNAALLVKQFQEKKVQLDIKPKQVRPKPKSTFHITPLAIVLCVVLVVLYTAYFNSLSLYGLPLASTTPNYSGCSSALCEEVGIGEQASVSVTGKYPRYLPMFRLPKMMGEQNFEGIHTFFFNIALPSILTLSLAIDIWRHNTWKNKSNQPGNQPGKEYGIASITAGDKSGTSTGSGSHGDQGLGFLR